MDLYNREIISYSISLSPNLQQIRDMLGDLFAKLPDDATPIFHSDQGWQYQHTEYQRLFSEHNIKQSMSRKGNCMDNGAMENFSVDLKSKCSTASILIQLMNSSTVLKSTFITTTMKELFLN